MKKIFFSLVCLKAFLISGCAVGPLVSHETARTVGDNNHELIAGYGQAGIALKWNYGVTEDLDLGLHIESLSTGLRAKYAFINAQDGWSLATALGIGASLGGSHYYGDIIGSYLAGSWEPYLTTRVVRVKTDPLDFRDRDTGELNFRVDRMHYSYGQLILGTRYWFNPHWLLSVEASSFLSLSSGLKIKEVILLGASFGYRF